MVKRPVFGRLRSGFTIPELLVVIGIIAILIALIMPALAGALRTADLMKSMSRMKQIGLWMHAYAGENREIILPSQVDYRDPASPSSTLNNYPVKVRSDVDLGALRWQATWTDILWTQNGMGEKTALQDPSLPADTDIYLFDSPDQGVYGQTVGFDDGPFRSSAPNTRELPSADGVPKPFGAGAKEYGNPGFFAANDFFDARWDAPPLNNPTGAGTISTPPLGRWYATGQILRPDSSMYLVDSHAGETIQAEPNPAAFQALIDLDGDGAAHEDNPDCEVDFRYNNSCLMLFLDGHVDPTGQWTDICELEKIKKIRVRELDRKKSTYVCP